MKEYRRKHFFTEKKYQLKYTAIIMLSMLLVAIVIAATFYWDFSQLSIKYANESLRWDKYAVRLIFLLAVAFLTGIFLSHKIIGPLRRLEEIIEKINNGEFNVRLKLRTGDDFKILSEKINKLAKKLKAISKKYPEFKAEISSQDKN